MWLRPLIYSCVCVRMFMRRACVSVGRWASVRVHIWRPEASLGCHPLNASHFFLCFFSFFFLGNISCWSRTQHLTHRGSRDSCFLQSLPSVAQGTPLSLMISVFIMLKTVPRTTFPCHCRRKKNEMTFTLIRLALIT